MAGTETTALVQGIGIEAYVGKIVDGGDGREYISRVNSKEIITHRRVNGIPKVFVRNFLDYDPATVQFMTSGEASHGSGRIEEGHSFIAKCERLGL